MLLSHFSFRGAILCALTLPLVAQSFESLAAPLRRCAETSAGSLPDNPSVASALSDAMGEPRYPGMPYCFADSFEEADFANWIFESRELPDSVKESACFGQGTPHPDWTAQEAAAALASVMRSYGRDNAESINAFEETFLRAARGKTFSGCRLSLAKDPWSEDKGLFVIGQGGDLKLGLRYGWAE